MGSNLCCQQVKNNSNDQIDIQVVRNPKSQQPSQIIQPFSVSLHQPSYINTNAELTTPNKIQVIAPVQQKQVYIPQLSQPVLKYLEKQNPFPEKKINTFKPRRCRGNIYQGQINMRGQPNGFGIMYYPNGNVLVGEFKQGNVNGKVHHVWNDGTYYQGHVQKNNANDENGLYVCQNYTYRGNIKNNQMTGYGTLQGKGFRYVGKLENGRKTQGELYWKQTQNKNLPNSSSETDVENQYTYTGKFDENENFVGGGVLKTSKGIYKGNFKNNLKDGKGTFQYENGLKYQGDYKNDIKEGYGTIYSKKKIIVYSGQIKNGLPHGKGKVPNPFGQLVETQWVSGVSKDLLKQSQLLQK